MASKKTIATIAVVIVALFAGGLWFYLSRQVKSEDDSGVIRVTISTVPGEWEIANELSGGDVFKETGVKTKLVPPLSGGWNGMIAILAGKLDIAGGGWVGWINVIARGGKIKAVSPGWQLPQDRQGGILVLEGSDIHSIKDLAGKTVAVNILGLTGDYTLKLLLKQNGIPVEKVQILPVPTESQEQALRTKQIDAVADTMCGGISFDRTLDHGGVRLIPHSGNRDVQGENVATGTGFREEFIQAHPDQVRRFVEALEKARDIIWAEFQKDPARVRAAYAAVAKRKGGNPALAKYYSPGFSPDHRIIKDSDVQWWIDLLVAEGKLKPGQVKPGDVYTNEFNPSLRKTGADTSVN
jgi:ABC-type nitrate/sulfonate/bicarbonate transport system substrate-binding protein